MNGIHNDMPRGLLVKFNKTCNASAWHGAVPNNENSGDENENLEEEIVLSEDSESDDDDLPPPPPKPKLVIEIDLNRGNPDATGVLEQMDKEKKEQPIGDDGTHDLFQDRRRKKNRTLFSLRTSERKFFSLIMGKSRLIPRTTKVTK